MDYPAPDVRVTDGKMDFSNTYGVGVGPWDKFAATWLYSDSDDAQRAALVQDALSKGLIYVADSDARSRSTGHPLGNIWDNGADPVTALNEVMKVRKLALDNFGPDRIKEGQLVADLNKVIVPIYLYHRYQVAAAGKPIGGMTFNYGLKGDGQPAAKVVAVSEQRRALTALLETLDPKALDIKDETLNLLTPMALDYALAQSDREMFRRSAYPAFDVTAAADTAADLTFDVLLDKARAARLVEFNRRDPAQLGLDELLATTRRTVMGASTSGRTGEIAKTVQARYAFALMELTDSNAPSSVRTRASSALDDLVADLNRRGGSHGIWFERTNPGPIEIALFLQ